jgi:hypothetical protein
MLLLSADEARSVGGRFHCLMPASRRALLVDLAAPLFQFGDQCRYALGGQCVRSIARQSAVFQNFHFERNPRVFVGQSRPLPKEEDGPSAKRFKSILAA